MRSRLLLVEKCQVGDDALTFKQRVQEIKQTGPGELLSEDNLEANVGERIDELSHCLVIFVQNYEYLLIMQNI
jgi:hypothetical protein